LFLFLQQLLSKLNSKFLRKDDVVYRIGNNLLQLIKASKKLKRVLECHSKLGDGFDKKQEL